MDFFNGFYKDLSSSKTALTTQFFTKKIVLFINKSKIHQKPEKSYASKTAFSASITDVVLIMPAMFWSNMGGKEIHI